MTDLEITRLCAEAMYAPKRVKSAAKSVFYEDAPGQWVHFDPFDDDAQCFALVKKFNIQIEGYPGDYSVCVDDNCASPFTKDLNRAICECIASMQEKKVAA